MLKKIRVIFLVMLVHSLGFAEGLGLELKTKENKNKKMSILKKVGEISVANGEQLSFNKESLETAAVSDKYIAITTRHDFILYDKYSYRQIKKIKKPIINYSNLPSSVYIDGEKIYFGYDESIVMYDIKSGSFKEIISNIIVKPSNLIVLNDKIFVIDKYRGRIAIYSINEKKLLKAIDTVGSIYDYDVADQYFLFTLNSAQRGSDLHGIDINSLDYGSLRKISSTTSGLIKMTKNRTSNKNQLLFIGYDNSGETVFILENRNITKQTVPGITFSEYFGTCGNYVYSYARHILSFYNKTNLHLVESLSDGKLGMDYHGEEDINKINDNLNYLDLSNVGNISCNNEKLYITIKGYDGRVDIFDLKNNN